MGKSDRQPETRSFLAKIDGGQLSEIQKRHAGSGARYAKYADVEHWLAEAGRSDLFDKGQTRTNADRLIIAYCELGDSS